MIMRRFRRSYRRQLIAIAVLVIVLVARWWSAAFDSASERTPVRHLPAGVYEVQRVIDGDTLQLSGGRGRVRLQGIDTPELAMEGRPVEAYADEARHAAEAFIRDARYRVRLEMDGESVDRFGRTLAFVWFQDRMLNEELVRAGLARAKLGYDYSQAKKNRLRRAQQEAQRQASGLWSQETP
jgi:micrococcal nuclease